MWFVRRSRFEGLLRDYRDMQAHYWEMSSHVVDVTADNENLKREVKHLRGRLADLAQGKGGRVR